MDLSRRLRTTALVICIFLVSIQQIQSRFHGLRHKRQYGANLYLSESSITPGGEGDDPNEWTEWSSPSECSRSCGGGVSYQTRECRRTDERGEPICTGGNRRYYSCNTQDCPDDETDFRAAQCARFNRETFDGVLYDWVPYTNAPNPCELNCMPKGERFYYRQKEKVIDGTRCNDKDFDVCVDGQCQPVGCDMMLGSNAKEDKCRRCNGDGSSCRTIADTFTTSNLAAGYNDILLIPNGATNIRIQETAPSNNYLAARNLTGHYYLNGNWRIDFPRPMLYAGSWWNYQRKPAGFAAPDHLTCSGPITESIYIVMLVQDKNVSIDYEYSIPDSVSQSTPEVYTWTHMEFEPCSASCGGGTQSREVKCNNRLNLQEVDPSLCDQHAKPAENQECGTEPCAPHWVESEWSKCSKGCGADGNQNRTVTCERISPTGEHTSEEDSVCLQLVGNKPATTQECNRDVKNCPKYHLGPWTPCDKLCDEGKQTRKVTCFIEENGHKRVLKDEDCVEEKPETEKSCTLAACEGVDWITSEWSGCDACGQNKETRTAICGSKSGKVYPDVFCAPEVPLLTRECKAKKCDSQWFSSEWSKCSAPCGKGVQSRIVICGVFDGKSVSPVDDSKCSADTKPEVEQECEGEETKCPGQWFTGPWDACSKECGGGERTREVLCLANGTKADNCDEAKLEPISEKCNTEPCTEDKHALVGSTAKPADDEDDEDEEDDECSEDEEDDETGISEGIDLDGDTTTLSSLITDELMLSDSPSDESSFDELSSDVPLSTLEGSGSSFDTTEGSGDDDSTTDLTGSTESSVSTDSTSEGSTESSVSTESSSEGSTESSVSTESSSEGNTESSVSTESSSEGSTESSVSTESSSEGSTESSISTESSSEGSTESSVSTESTSEGSTDSSVSTESSSEGSTDSSVSTESSSEGSTESSVSTESTSESSTDSSVSTESTSESSTDSSASTESTSDDSTESSVSTESTESTSESSTDSTESTSDLTTESTSESSSESTESSTTDVSSTDSSSTDGSSESSTSDGTSLSTSESTDDTTDISGSTGTDISESTFEESSTSEFTTDGASSETTETGSTDSSDSTESTDTTESPESTESTSETSDSSTDVSGSTDISGSTEVSGSTESTSEISESSTDVSGSTASEAITESSSTEEILSTTSGISESTESSSSGATDESTETGETEESTTEGSTDSSLSTEGSTTEDIWSTSEDDDDENSSPNTLDAVITREPKLRKCKPKDCEKTTFGCCPDKKTVAKGPFDKGCPIPKTCADTKYGCCLDGVSPAQGKKNKGCPKSQCAETLFGCCSDKFTPAEGENEEGCPEPTTLPPTTTVEVTISEEVEVSEVDATTTTVAPEQQPARDDCQSSSNGCCADGRTPATGPNGEGCAACTQEPFGCCPDKQTPAHGPLYEGCCLNSPYGCCPDNINSARGPNFEDCECNYTPYGCCPDKKTAARGPNSEGCPCENSPHGCCPDKITAAQGPKFEGCACETTQFGCCPDGLTFAQGPHHYGCHCSQTEFKCCQDDKTPAKGPNFEGCTCLENKFGCCTDGVTPAQGEKFEGCENVKEPLQKACALPKTTGPCSNFSIKYHFDTTYGACAKFWYGGCEGNNNRFESEGECKQVCEEYTGKDVCYLPKVPGPCTSFSKKWYFDSDRNRCEQFSYGGCYGNHNRFETQEECQAACAASENLPPCEQPAEPGPCEGNFERWFYDNETDVCRPFNYGGCKGNKNNYPTEHACNYNCRQPGVLKDSCSLPKQTGDCSEQHPRWYFSETDKRCMPFYYTGCGGNKNNFPSQDSCEDHCPRQVAKDICEIPAEVGECTNYTPMWYYDTKEERCAQFYYGGCGGNANRFQSDEACLARCEKRPEPTTPPPPPLLRPSSNVCEEPASPGDCSNYVLQWYYDGEHSTCRQFYFGGCGGNGNRFATEDECSRRCSGQPEPEPEPQPQPQPEPEQQPRPEQQPESQPSQDLCSQPSAQGECDEWEQNYFFNATTERCEPFYYGGCGGNDNRFKTEDECTGRCATINTRFGGEDDNAKCFLPAERGACENNETRWYYNSDEGLCDEFVFSGCGGNENNYASEDDCQNECIDAQNTCSLPPVRGRCYENSIRWYFDERTRRCHEFEFTGCRGNRNNFVTEVECLNYCGAEQPPPPPPVSNPDYCNQQPEAGECDNATTAWFYDSEKLVCTAFSYSGCGGNDNRFVSKEQCERQCGEFRGVDVCNQPVHTGPCTQWETRFYYNQQSHTCEPFTYGGCDGNGNRFSNRAECENICNVNQEQQPKDICQLPVLTGRCNGPSVSERRWYYDDARGTCVSFIYTGCSGNQNNFRSFEACTNYCGKPVDTTNNEITNCDSYEEQCRELRCPFGVRRVPVDNEECTRCECENPCERYSCPTGQQCAVDFADNDRREFVPVCRDITKPGECPPVSARTSTNSTDCGRECYTDADCREDTKCCDNGCGQVCVHPARPTERPSTQPPAIVYPGDRKATLEPKTPKELDVATSLGGIAVLRCFATGNPAPNVTWSRGNVLIDTNQGRYVLTSNGDLTVVQVRQTDDGTYVCVASNGLGEPVRREIQLQVTEPKDIAAYIYGDRNTTQIVTLNNPAHVRCPAGGYPVPHVTWWRNEKRLGLVNERFEQTRDNALTFRSIQLNDLGPYTCDVYNGHGRPASLVITLKAVGPARAATNEDSKYLQYIIEPARAPATRRPAYSRPIYVPPPIIVIAPRPQPTVNAQAVLGLDPRNSYSPGSTIAISCAVQGYPTPNVTWTKDGIPLSEDGRIQITSEPYRLVVNDVTTEDTGVYGCTARNSFSYSTSEEKINIESSIPVSPECIDNPYFANCKLIVKGQYCRNHYYAKFCCRSCTLAGQITQAQHPNAL